MSLELDSKVTPGRRGAKPLTRRDWIFGSRPRRLALHHVLTSEPPSEGWSKTELARVASVSPNGGVDEHVQGLLEIGILEVLDSRRPPRYRLAEPVPLLATRLKALLAALDEIPDE